ncbi:MAG TPA: glycosyltransferase family 39 protein [Flavisolibacter sp.]|nr:glycosyltransferase family 39 protein [Flavisolibacter sp.]
MNLKKFFQNYSLEFFLFFTTLFIRFPFFFRDYIDQDESTFILMGQSIADGHLPYDHLWDLKPPLLFYFFAVIEKIFPHSFVAIRFFGVLVVFLSAILLLRIAKLTGLRNGFLIAAGYILLSSEFGSLQGVMSEHFAVFFLLLGLIFLLKKRNGYDLARAGMAFGCASLCKLNYAYAITALLIFYFINNHKKENFKQAVRFIIIPAIGILIPVILISIPYIAAGKMDLFINSVFLAPLEYARALDYQWIDKLKTTWWIIVLMVCISYLSLRYSKENSFIVFSCIAILTGTVYTFYSSGIINGHYLVQIYPFLLLLLFGVIIQKTIQPKLKLAVAVIFLLSFESLLEYSRLIQGLQNPVEYRPTFEVVNELKKKKLDNDKIFFADYHVGYWLLKQYPLTKSTTHPSNLSRPYLFKYYNDSSKTSLEELKYIMEEIQPKVIVSESDGLDFFPEDSPENIYFKQNVDKDFEIIYKDTVDGIYIWERESE